MASPRKGPRSGPSGNALSPTTSRLARSPRGGTSLFLNSKKKIVLTKEKEDKPVEWRRKKILNPETNKWVFEDSAVGKTLRKEEKYRLQSTCPPGYRYKFSLKKCVKITKEEEEERRNTRRGILKECPVGTVRNPLTKRCVNIESKAGKRALKLNYERNFWGI